MSEISLHNCRQTDLSGQGMCCLLGPVCQNIKGEYGFKLVSTQNSDDSNIFTSESNLLISLKSSSDAADPIFSSLPGKSNKKKENKNCMHFRISFHKMLIIWHSSILAKVESPIQSFNLWDFFY